MITCVFNDQSIRKPSVFLFLPYLNINVYTWNLLQGSIYTLISYIQDLWIIFWNKTGTLSGIYSQLSTGDETLRERCIKFLSKKVIPIDRNIIDRAAEDFLIVETKKVLQVNFFL